jgi:hypothetical protein
MEGDMDLKTLIRTKSKGLVQAVQLQKYAQPVEFPPGEISTKSTYITVYPWATYLRVPAYTCAVLAGRGGVVLTYLQGENILDLPYGTYEVHYVNMKPQPTCLPEVHGITQDGWEVTLSVNLLWRVTNPREAASIDGFCNHIARTVWGFIVDYARSVKHDQLIPVSGEPVINARQIENRIREQLALHPAFQGIRIMSVVFQGCSGDQQRAKIAQQAVVDKVKIREANAVEAYRLEQKVRLLGYDRQFLGSQQEFDLEKAKNSLELAKEQQKLSLQHAETRTSEARALRPMKLQEIEMAQRFEMLQLQHAENLSSDDVRKATLGQMAAVLLQNQAATGIMRPLDDDGRASIVRAMEVVANPSPARLSLPSQESALPRPLSLRERISSELGRILSLPGARCDAMQFLDDGGIQVVVYYLNFRIAVTCGSRYPDEPPQQITLCTDHGSETRHIAMHWSQGFTLLEVVLEAARQGADEFFSGDGSAREDRPR